MDKRETLAYLGERGIRYELTEHKAVFDMAELGDIELPYPDDGAKNLFVRDAKKRNYYLISVRGDKRVDLKEFRREQGTRALSFASADDLKDKLKLTPGSVTPLGLLNDTGHEVVFYLDASFVGGRIGVHPNDNTATVWMRTDDLVDVLQSAGTDVHIVKI